MVHGIGDQNSDFAEELIAQVSARLHADADAVFWQPVWWAPVLSGKQVTLLENLARGGDLDWMDLRRFVVSAFGDAVAYQRVFEGARHSTYDAIHVEVAKALHALHTRLRRGFPDSEPPAPLVVVAHSLGCHIMSNHIWDLQHKIREPEADNAFERAETLAGMVTFGCNIPLFTLAYDEPKPIAFPAADLPRHFPSGTNAGELAAATRWLNLYDSDDVLGFPLKPLSSEYTAVVSEDREVNSGGLFDSWTPLSHTNYWGDREVTHPIADLLQGLLRLL